MSYICGPCEEARHDQCDKPNCSCNCHVPDPPASNIWVDIDARILNRVTDKVLSYKPKPKTKAAKKRARRNKRKKKRD
jgi:hypothetical protein